MRIAWITAAPISAIVGGGATYSRSVFRVFEGLPQTPRLIEVPLRSRPMRLGHKLEQGMAFARASLSKLPAKAKFQMPCGAVRALRRKIAAIEPDIAVLGSADLLPCRAALDGVPFVLIAHNVEQQLYEDQVRAAMDRFRFGPAAWWLSRDLAKLRRMETEGVRAANLIIAVSRNDADTLQELGARSPVFVLPPTFPGPLPDHPRPAVERPLKLALVAKMTWWPNRKAVDWLAREVMTRLPSGTAELHLYGPGSERIADRKSGVFGHGFVPDLREVWRAGHIAVCPVHQGGGVNVKVAEAIFNGSPILATPHGLRGLPAMISDPAVAVRGSSAEWIDFLQSNDAEDLASRTPKAETRMLFADSAYVAPLGDALARSHS
ncbi:MAG TPA: glycosyltransferase [Hyphomicrobiaceae bacterium]